MRIEIVQTPNQKREDVANITKAIERLRPPDRRQAFEDAAAGVERSVSTLTSLAAVEAGLIAAAGFLLSRGKITDPALLFGSVALAIGIALTAIGIWQTPRRSYLSLDEDATTLENAANQVWAEKAVREKLRLATLLLGVAAILLFGSILGRAENLASSTPKDDARMSLPLPINRPT